MTRTKRMFLTAGLSFAALGLTLDTHVQAQGGRGGRGQQQQRGGNQPGGPGGGQQQQRGGRAQDRNRSNPEADAAELGSVITLVGNEVVQKELNINEKQKAAIKKLVEDQTKKRKDMLQRLSQRMDSASNQAALNAQAQAFQQGQAARNSNATGLNNDLTNSINSYGEQPYAMGTGGQLSDLEIQQMAMMQGRMAANATRTQGQQMMRQATLEFRRDTERALARVLDKNQVARLLEIELQVDGPASILRDDIAMRLEIRDEQYPDIQTAVVEGNMARRQFAASSAQALQSLRGGRGNRGSQTDPATIQAALKKPENAAKIAEARKASADLRNKQYNVVYKAMDKRQVTGYQKMLGKPFDVDLVVPGPFQAFGTALMKTSDKSADAEKGDEPTADKSVIEDKTEEAPAQADAPASKGTEKKAPSLRERRGLGGQASNATSPR